MDAHRSHSHLLISEDRHGLPGDVTAADNRHVRRLPRSTLFGEPTWEKNGRTQGRGYSNPNLEATYAHVQAASLRQPVMNHLRREEESDVSDVLGFVS